MAEREQIRKNAPTRETEEIVDEPTAGASGSDLKSDIDDMLDEIDEVLETNAEEFVRSYVQKGGQ